MGKVYVATCAYNAQDTLKRCVDSVLNQTYDNIVYYLCDNASTDKTREMVDEYAERDSRIVKFHNKVNHVWNDSMEYVTLPHHIPLGDYYCILDADDTLEPNFIEEMIGFLEQNSLDIAVCGNSFIDAKSKKKVGERAVRKALLLLSRQDFGENYPYYHVFMRTGWAKLYTSRAAACRIAYSEFPPRFPKAYGGDTFIIFDCLSKITRAGVYPGILYNYYMSTGSVSNRWHPQRIECDVILHESARNFLIQKCGFINTQNQMFLNGVYYHAINDTLNVLFKSNLSPLQKMISLKEIFTCQYTLDLFNQSDIYVRLEADCASIVTWILAQNICRRREGANLASQILVAMYKNRLEWIDQKDLEEIILILPELVEYILKKDYKWILERLHKWFKRHDSDVPALVKLQITAYRFLKKPEDEYFTLLAEIKKSKPQSSKKLNIDNLIYKQIEKYPMLKNMSVDFLCIFLSTVRWILKNDYTKAIEAFASLSELEINDDYTEQYLVFSQNLAAGAERADIFIYFKKLWISYLLERKRIEEASNELYEFEQIMPDDEDFLSLRNKIRHAKYSL